MTPVDINEVKTFEDFERLLDSAEERPTGRDLIKHFQHLPESVTTPMAEMFDNLIKVTMEAMRHDGRVTFQHEGQTHEDIAVRLECAKGMYEVRQFFRKIEDSSDNIQMVMLVMAIRNIPQDNVLFRKVLGQLMRHHAHDASEMLQEMFTATQDAERRSRTTKGTEGEGATTQREAQEA